jgi:hypothetical protein
LPATVQDVTFKVMILKDLDCALVIKACEPCCDKLILLQTAADMPKSILTWQPIKSSTDADQFALQNSRQRDTKRTSQAFIGLAASEILTRSASEGVHAVSRWRFGLVWKSHY